MVTHSTHACGSTPALQTWPDGQSVFVVQGSAVHTPIVPSSFEQYFPVEQCVEPSWLRQPSMHTPVATVVLSQI